MAQNEGRRQKILRLTKVGDRLTTTELMDMVERKNGPSKRELCAIMGSFKSHWAKVKTIDDYESLYQRIQ